MKKVIIICPECKRVKKFGEFVPMTSLILMSIYISEVEFIDEPCLDCTPAGAEDTQTEA